MANFLAEELKIHTFPNRVCLLSIHSTFAHLIYQSRKRYEFRKVKPNISIKIFLLYETSPQMMVTGAFFSNGIISDTPEKLWDKTSHYAGVERDYFLKYYANKYIGHAICISHAIKFSKKFRISEIQNDISRPPQSFQYITLEHHDGR